MKLPGKIRSINDALKIGKAFSHGWFRGHDLAYNNLTPKAFRKNYPQGIDVEFHFIQKFKINAPVVEEKVPDSNDFLAWLILAQHFGLPTRLLDWTESILVALWFSVNENRPTSAEITTKIGREEEVAREIGENAELWAMNPASLNKFHNSKLLHDDIALGENPLIQYLAEQPMVRKEMRYQTAVNRDWKNIYKDFHIPQYPIAFMPQKTFQRQAYQLSVFTIHPRPKNGNSIENILINKDDLFRFIIPGKSKEKLRMDLSDLGITKRMLFDNLESLSYDIIKEICG
jgi:hypothetical protein